MDKDILAAENFIKEQYEKNKNYESIWKNHPIKKTKRHLKAAEI